MNIKINIDERKPSWIALSCFYLDNELQDSDFKYIAQKIIESPYDLEQIKKIDKEEIFPVLYSNLLHPTGVWTAFKEDWLIAEIIKNLEKSNKVNKLANSIKYSKLKWMYEDYWTKLETALQK